MNPHATSRIQLPEGASAEAGAPATVKMKPISPITPAAAKPITPLQPQTPPVPGANPLPAGPKPPSAAQVQAAKSKTSRISLDSAIGVAPVSPAAPKTIKLKRPVDLGAPKPVAAPSPKSATAPLHQTSKVPASAVPEESASVTQKKTLKIKRPGLAHQAPAAEAAPEGAPAEDPNFQNLSPIADLNALPQKESSAFTAVALTVSILAAVTVILLTLCLGAHAIGPAAGPNSLATIKGPELPWFGRITD